MTETLDVQRAPLNLYDARRVAIPDTGDWVEVYAPPRWRVPAGPIDPEVINDTAALVSNAFICALGETASTVTVRMTEGANSYLVVSGAVVQPNQNLKLNMGRAIIPSGSVIEARVDAGPAVALHLSFILNTAETIQEV